MEKQAVETGHEASQASAPPRSPSFNENQKERTSTGSNRSHIRMSKVNTKLREVLKAYDKDGDQKITRTELEEVIKHLVSQQFKNKIFLYFLVALTVYFLLLAGGLFGLTWAVIYANKDMEVNNGVWMVKGGSEAVSLGSTDLAVVNGHLVMREANSTGRTLTTSTLGTKTQLLDSTPYADLQKIKAVVVQGMRLPPQLSVTAQAMVNVRAVSRSTLSTNPLRYSVRMDTAAGTLVLEGGAWFLEGAAGAGALLADAGLVGLAVGQRARLQGAASGESFTIYGYSNQALSGAAASCSSRVAAGSCGAGYLACNSPDWTAFSAANFALCEKVNYGVVNATASFCC